MVHLWIVTSEPRRSTEVKECWPIGLITFLLKRMFNYTFINVQLGNLICNAGLKFAFITSASCGPKA